MGKFNTIYYARKGSNSNSIHEEAKARIRSLLESDGWEILYHDALTKEIMYIYFDPLYGTHHKWPLDVYAVKVGKDFEYFLDVEVDGYSHENRKAKDKVRDEQIRKGGIRVLRIPKEDVIGKHSLRDEEIMAMVEKVFTK